MSFAYCWLGPGASAPPERNALAAERSASASDSWIFWASMIAGTVLPPMLSIVDCVAMTAAVPRTARRPDPSATNRERVRSRPGVVDARALTPSAASVEGMRRDRAWFTASVLERAVPYGDPREAPDLDDVVGLDQLDLCAHHRQAVQLGAVGRAQIANSPGPTQVDDLRVPSRDVGVRRNGNVNAVRVIPADDDRRLIDDEDVVGRVHRWWRTARLIGPLGVEGEHQHEACGNGGASPVRACRGGSDLSHRPRGQHLPRLEVVGAAGAVPIVFLPGRATHRARRLGRGAPPARGPLSGVQVLGPANIAIVVAEGLVPSPACESHQSYVLLRRTVRRDLVSSVISSSFETSVFSLTVPRSGSSMSTTRRSSRVVSRLPAAWARLAARPRRYVAV